MKSTSLTQLVGKLLRPVKSTTCIKSVAKILRELFKFDSTHRSADDTLLPLRYREVSRPQYYPFTPTPPPPSPSRPTVAGLPQGYRVNYICHPTPLSFDLPGEYKLSSKQVLQNPWHVGVCRCRKNPISCPTLRLRLKIGQCPSEFRQSTPNVGWRQGSFPLP